MKARPQELSLIERMETLKKKESLARQAIRDRQLKELDALFTDITAKLHNPAQRGIAQSNDNYPLKRRKVGAFTYVEEPDDESDEMMLEIASLLGSEDSSIAPK